MQAARREWSGGAHGSSFCQDGRTSVLPPQALHHPTFLTPPRSPHTPPATPHPHLKDGPHTNQRLLHAIQQRQLLIPGGPHIQRAQHQQLHPWSGQAAHTQGRVHRCTASWGCGCGRGMGEEATGEDRPISHCNCMRSMRRLERWMGGEGAAATKMGGEGATATKPVIKGGRASCTPRQGCMRGARNACVWGWGPRPYS